MQYKNPTDIKSSYSQNDIGKTFYDLVLKYKPKKIVEVGTLFGYSRFVIIEGPKNNGE
jgi:predicted O-methyltransferase YrrM